MREHFDTARVNASSGGGSCGRGADDAERCACGACRSSHADRAWWIQFVLVMLVAVAVVVVWWHGADEHRPLLKAEFGGGGGGGSSDTPFLLALINYIWAVLLNFFKWLGTVLDSIVKYLLDVARATAQGIVQLGKFFVRVWGLLRRFWSDVLKPILARVAKIIQQTKEFLERLFRPLIDLITKIRGWLQRIYKEVLRPILDIIDAFRLFLRGLGALGVDWAKELDQKLGQLEDKLTTPLMTAIRYLNQLAGYIDRIMTLDGLFQRLIWIQSLAGYRRPTIRFLWNSHSTPLSSSEVASVKAKYKPPSLEKTRDDVREYLTFRGGDLQPRSSELAQQMRIWLRNI